MKYYISDTHFGHENVIRFDERPFSYAEEMDEYMIMAWNARVQKEDEVYIVGDFVYRAQKSVGYYAQRLNGQKILITGNHDRIDEEDSRWFASVEKMMHVTDFYNGQNRQICLCHFPIAEWNGYCRGHYHIYGHIHNRINDTYYFMKTRDNALNAGCMINNYMPVTLAELIHNNKVFKELH